MHTPSRAQRVSPSLLSETTVSVALATFNGEQFLREQLDSLVSQTRLPDEVVIVDDRSTDATASVCEAFASRAPFPVRLVIHDANHGYIHAFETALRACEGDIVMLCDQDDVWYRTKVDVMTRALADHPNAQVAIHDVRFCDARLEPTGGSKLDRIRRVGDPYRHYVTGMATAVRRPFLQKTLPIPEGGVPHDKWLHACAVAVNAKLIVRLVLADYRRHGSNATKDRSLNAASDPEAIRMALAAYQAPSREQIATHILLVESVLAWLRSSIDWIVSQGLLTEKEVDARRKQYVRDVSWAQRRLWLVRLPRRRRLVPILRQWAGGGYRSFSGARSALKDLFRR